MYFQYLAISLLPRIRIELCLSVSSCSQIFQSDVGPFLAVTLFCLILLPRWHVPRIGSATFRLASHRLCVGTACATYRPSACPHECPAVRQMASLTLPKRVHCGFCLWGSGSAGSPHRRGTIGQLSHSLRTSAGCP